MGIDFQIEELVSKSMKLFEEIERINTSPSTNQEPDYYYLNTSARVEAEKVHRIIESWFSKYPASEQKELQARFMSDHNEEHYSAFFELFLHEVLLQRGCEVEVHPMVDNDTSKRPDFFVITPDGVQFYLEAVVSTGISESERAAQSRINVVLDSLDRLDTHNFYLSLDMKGAPRTPPPAKQFRANIKNFLDNLDYDEVRNLFQNQRFKELPETRLEHDGWRVDVTPIPKLSDVKGISDTRSIGMQSYECRISNTHNAIKGSIAKKAGRYGKMTKPYVIAVNSLSFSVDNIDIMDALFGREQWTYDLVQSDPVLREMSREKNGVWFGHNGPKNRRNSAVLLITKLTPWKIQSAKARIYHNPWAQNPCLSAFSRLPKAVSEGNKMKEIDGEAIGSIFELPQSWPED